MLKPIEDVGALVAALTTLSALAELAVVALCLAAAWLAVRAMRGAPARHDSVWFGDHIVDGVLFPALALAGALLARWALRDVIPIAVLRLAVPILSSLLIIRLGARVLRVAFPTSALVRVLERTLSWTVWIGLVLWAVGLLPLALAEMEGITWKLGGSDVSLRSLVEGALSAIMVMIAMLWLSAAIEARLLAGAGEPGYSGNLSVRKIAANALRAGLLLVGLLLALSAAGIPLGALGVMGGAVGVGIGLGLQKLAANYVSGFVILAERSLRIGDLVKVDNFEGRITDINTRYTVIRALNGRESIVPNEMLMTQRIENSTLADRRVVVNTTVQVEYGTDVEALMPVLVGVVAAVPRVLADPAPGVLLNAFAPDGLDLGVSFWITDPENGQGNVRSAVNLAILKALNERGVGIPFPQRVLHRAPGRRAGDAAAPT